MSTDNCVHGKARCFETSQFTIPSAHLPRHARLQSHGSVQRGRLRRCRRRQLGFQPLRPRALLIRPQRRLHGRRRRGCGAGGAAASGEGGGGRERRGGQHVRRCRAQPARACGKTIDVTVGRSAAAVAIHSACAGGAGGCAGVGAAARCGRRGCAGGGGRDDGLGEEHHAATQRRVFFLQTLNLRARLERVKLAHARKRSGDHACMHLHCAMHGLRILRIAHFYATVPLPSKRAIQYPPAPTVYRVSVFQLFNDRHAHLRGQT